LRDGSWKELEASELVPGDIVQVKMGDSIPADIRILEMKSVAFSADESSLTGEPVAVQKDVDTVEESAEDVIQA
jgi:Ca2+-transporting ATPase